MRHVHDNALVLREQRTLCAKRTKNTPNTRIAVETKDLSPFVSIMWFLLALKHCTKQVYCSNVFAPVSLPSSSGFTRHSRNPERSILAGTLTTLCLSVKPFWNVCLFSVVVVLVALFFPHLSGSLCWCSFLPYGGIVRGKNKAKVRKERSSSLPTTPFSNKRVHSLRASFPARLFGGTALSLCRTWIGTLELVLSHSLFVFSSFLGPLPFCHPGKNLPAWRRSALPW